MQVSADFAKVKDTKDVGAIRARGRLAASNAVIRKNIGMSLRNAHSRIIAGKRERCDKRLATLCGDFCMLLTE